jgi:hypothetical protein
MSPFNSLAQDNPDLSPIVRCPSCGEMHPIGEIEGSHERPDVVHSIGVFGRLFRVRNDGCFCMLDRKRYFVSGLLCFPVNRRSEDYCWGVWAEIDGSTFTEMDRLWNAEGRESASAFFGVIANEVPLFGSPLLGLEVAILMQPVGRKPHFRVLDESHPVYAEQSQGISEARAMGFNHYVLGGGA